MVKFVIDYMLKVNPESLNDGVNEQIFYLTEKELDENGTAIGSVEYETPEPATDAFAKFKALKPQCTGFYIAYHECHHDEPNGAPCLILPENTDTDGIDIQPEGEPTA